MSAAALPNVARRRAEEGDAPFFFRVYASTRWEELAPTGWTDPQKTAFLASQFQAQSVCYAKDFADAAFEVLLVDGIPAGRMIVQRGAREILLVDIALLPEFRRGGIGTALLRELQDEARSTERPLRIHVEKMNPAMRLYERLGFRKIDDRGVYDFMEWRAGGIS